MQPVTKLLAEFIAQTQTQALPDDLLERARKVLVDALACIVSGAGSETAPSLLAYIGKSGSFGSVPILGTERTTSAEAAALVNGTFGHALEYDDVFSMMPGHPAAVIAAATIGEFGKRPISGKELIEAFAIAYEVGARVGIAITLEHHRVRGFHATSTLGIFAAVACLCRLRGYDAQKTAEALSIAASFASGLLGQTGTSIKPLHSGWAARNAVTAVDMVDSGMTTLDNILEAPRGFFNAYGTPASRPERILEGLGESWSMISPGVALKKYPCCFAAHRGIDALLDLVAAHGIVFDDVGELICHVPPKGLINMVYKRPQTGLEAKFSMEYAFVSALLDGRSTLESFTDRAVQRELIQRSLGMVTNVEDPLCEGEGGEEKGEISGARGYCEMIVVMKDGRRYSQKTAHAPGNPARPLSWEELREKIGICAGHAKLDARESSAMIEALMSIKNAADMTDVLDALRPSAVALAAGRVTT